MRVRQLAPGAGNLGDPSAAPGRDPGLRVALIATPLALQPSAYVKASREERPFGRIREIEVRALHDGAQIAFLLEWEDPDRDTDAPGDERFPDGAALLFPLAEGAPLVTKGAEGKPVNAWHWRADRPSALATTWPPGSAPPA
jgi:DMSO reductase family type II enzyme heme b subunit